MLQLNLIDVGYAVRPLPNNTKALVLEDKQSGVTVVVPLDPDACKAISDGLRGSGIQIANGIPPKALR